MARGALLAAACLMACLALAWAARPGTGKPAGAETSSSNSSTGAAGPVPAGNHSSGGGGGGGSNASSSVGASSSRSAESRMPSLRQATTLAPLPAETRVIFARGKQEVEDYLEAIYGGLVSVAQADPFITAAGVAGSTGVPFTYEEQGSYDYEFGQDQASIGVGAKGIAASEAKLRQALIAKAATRGQAASTVAYTQNRVNSNALTASRTNAATLSAMGGGYVNKQQDNTDDFLEETPALDKLVLGRRKE